MFRLVLFFDSDDGIVKNVWGGLWSCKREDNISSFIYYRLKEAKKRGIKKRPIYCKECIVFIVLYFKRCWKCLSHVTHNENIIYTYVIAPLMKKYTPMRIEEDIYQRYKDYCEDNGYVIGTRIGKLMEMDMDGIIPERKPAPTKNTRTTKSVRDQWKDKVIGMMEQIQEGNMRCNRPREGFTEDQFRFFGKSVIEHPSDRRVRGMIDDLVKSKTIEMINGYYYYIPTWREQYG